MVHIKKKNLKISLVQNAYFFLILSPQCGWQTGSSLWLTDLTDGGSAISRCPPFKMRLGNSGTTKEAGRGDELSPEVVSVINSPLCCHHEKSELATWANVPPKARTSPSRSRGEATRRNIYNAYPDAGKDRGQKEKRVTEDEMVGWHHQRTWVWADSERQWRTGKPGVLGSLGSQRLGQNGASEHHHLGGRRIQHACNTIAKIKHQYPEVPHFRARVGWFERVLLNT